MRIRVSLAALVLIGLYPHAGVAAHARLPLHERFVQANTTHDGHLTLEQAKVGMKSVAHRFKAMDKEQKGYVTEADIHAYYKALRHRVASAPAPATPQGTVASAPSP